MRHPNPDHHAKDPRMATKDLPTPDLLRQLLRYDAETGKLFWRERPLTSFADKRCGNTWNARWAGNEALNYVDAVGYASGRIHGNLFMAHRVIWAIESGEWPTLEIDHINGNRSDNRLSNLRQVSRAENAKNVATSTRNKSGRVGVHFAKREQRWLALIGSDRRSHFLGYFDDFEAAVAARAAAEIEFGFHINHGRGGADASSSVPVHRYALHR